MDTVVVDVGYVRMCFTFLALLA